eukprot:6205552-Pleurochrysis_carterae.AAC.3
MLEVLSDATTRNANASAGTQLPRSLQPSLLERLLGLGVHRVDLQEVLVQLTMFRSRILESTSGTFRVPAVRSALLMQRPAQISR